jgi:hypothetical protein
MEAAMGFVTLLLLLTVITGCRTSPAPPAPSPRPPSTLGAVIVVDMIPASLSGEENQDSEPFLSVHPTDPRKMAASAFTPNPEGTASGFAPVFVSEDDGNTWSLRNIVPSAGPVGTGDITHASTGGTAAALYAGILRIPGNLLLNELRTLDFASSDAMSVQASRSQIDQPFVQAARIGLNDRVYVGNNDFGAAPRTATLDASLDGGTTWKSVRIEARDTAGQDGPSVRPTVARDGTVYAAYFGWRSFDGTVATSDVVVVRDDSAANTFQALVGSDGLPGRVVAQGASIPWSNAPTLGQERIGSTLSIAVDPNNSATVYVAWGDRVGSDIYTIHVRRSTDRGMSWSADARVIANATNAALAVANNGTVGLLYQRVDGSGPGSRWETRLEQTRDAFTTTQSAVLASVPADTPPIQFLPYIGDYNYLLAVGDEFRGVFSANNTPDLANFPQGVKFQRRINAASKTLEDASGQSVASSIDPFYFSIPVVQ